MNRSWFICFPPFLPQRGGRHFVGGEVPRGGRSQPPAPARRARKMAAAGRAWRAALLLSPWRLRAPCRAYGAAAGGGGGGGGGGRRLLLGAAFALGGGTGLYLAAQHRLREHSAAEVTRRRARSVPEAGLAFPPPRSLASRLCPRSLSPFLCLLIPPRPGPGGGGEPPGARGRHLQGARSGFCRL